MSVNYRYFLQMARRSVSYFRTVEPVAENITLDTDIIKTLSFYMYKQNSDQRRQGGNMIYELQLPETKRLANKKSLVWMIDDWRGVVGNVMKAPLCYPTAVHRELMSVCPSLVYSPPEERKELLDQILLHLMESKYKVNPTLYFAYLSAIHEMRQQPDLEKVFSDMETLNIRLNYNQSPTDRRLADLVCLFLALEGRTNEMRDCWVSFTKSPSFNGFSNRSFSTALVGHAVRGESEELMILQQRMETSGYFTPSIARPLTLAFARTGQIEMLQSLLPLNTIDMDFFSSLLLELVNSGHEQTAVEMLEKFDGLEVQSAITLRSLVHDLISRGALDLAISIIIHAEDFVKFKDWREQGLFKNQTLNNINENMPWHFGDVIVKMEMEGVKTGYKVTADMISERVVEELGKVEILSGNKMLERLYFELAARYDR
eukprot:sb/3464908/